MGFNSAPKSSLEMNWTATGNRLIEKVNLQRSELLKVYGEDSDAAPLVVLNNLETRIHDLFPAYENNQMSVDAVEEDLQYQIDNAEGEEEKIILKQIRAMVKSSGGPLF